jgi:hypothetical protein
VLLSIVAAAAIIWWRDVLPAGGVDVLVLLVVAVAWALGLRGALKSQGRPFLSLVSAEGRLRLARCCLGEASGSPSACYGSWVARLMSLGLSLLTLWDERLELAIGIHTAQNLMAVIGDALYAAQLRPIDDAVQCDSSSVVVRARSRHAVLHRLSHRRLARASSVPRGGRVGVTHVFSVRHADLPGRADALMLHAEVAIGSRRF